MLANWKFWVAIINMIVFIAIWVTEGFFWAMAILTMMSVVWVYMALAPKIKQSPKVYMIEDEDGPGTTYVIKTRRGYIGDSHKESFIKNRDLYVPKVNKGGAEFISGASSLRNTQKDGMRRIRKNLWGK